MGNLFCSSIGKKLLMSLSGLFLIIFLIIHLAINLTLLVDSTGETFNQAANFMALPLIKFGLQPVLGLGFIFHIFYGSLLTAQNNKARGSIKYASGNATKEVMWASKNMFVLGLTILAFLVVHLLDYWVPLQITGQGVDSVAIGGTEMHDTYALVKANLQNPYKAILYIIGSLGLALHLTHGFWSAFQSLGASNSIWRKRWTVIGTVFAWVINLGFVVIAVCMLLS